MTNGWQVYRFSDLLTRYSNNVKVAADKSYKLLGISLEGRGAFLREDKTGDSISATTLSPVHAGDFIYSRLFAWRGAFDLVPQELDGCFVSNEFPTFKINTEILFPKFLRLYFNRRVVWEEVEKYCTGTTKASRNRFKEQFFLGMEIPLPPLAEQRRIVAYIESLAARVNEAKRLREEADVEAAALHGTFAAKALNEVSSVPKYCIDDICDVRGGIQKSPARLPGANPIPYLTVAHVQRNHIDVSSETRYFEVLPEELPRWKLETGDLLIIEGNGSADQIGRVALYHGELGTCVHQNHVIRARPNTETILSEYLNMYLNSPLGQDEVQKRSRTTSGLRTLSVGRIREIEIPIPPLDKQRRIVACLDGLQAKVNALREFQSASRQALSALMPSVLDRAFKGEL